MPQTPAVPEAPVAPVIATTQEGARIIINGQAVTSPQATYQGFLAQRRELQRQMERLQSNREDISSELSVPTISAADKKGLEQRLTSIDERLGSLDKQIADADAQVARAASIPGAAVELPPPPRDGPPEEAWVLGGMFIVVVLLPLSIAYARRIWRRSTKVITTFPKELSDRLMHVEQSVEATALEVERIGEGQRFMTKLFTEGPAAQALHAQQRIGTPSSGP